MRLRLRELIFVMRKVQIDPATVDIDGLTENVAAHRGALDVPPRATHTPGRAPARLTVFAHLPKHKVKIALLFALFRLECALSIHGFRDVFHGVLIQLAVLVVLRRLESLDVKVHAAVGLVRESFVNDDLNVQNHLIHVLRNPRQHVRSRHAQGFHILHELGFELVRERQVSILNRPIFRATVLGIDPASYRRLHRVRQRPRGAIERP
mmetsp:Transcript_6476/g.25946  ORF Transcript_6476/g.25946 Transcript_6476/m.25946 type:complete len:208 (+) Transcript_6476:3244-3867(+)